MGFRVSGIGFRVGWGVGVKVRVFCLEHGSHFGLRALPAFGHRVKGHCFSLCKVLAYMEFRA